MGLIATNTIGQGDTRESGLRYLLQEKNGEIYSARRRVKWPGEAAVVVSTVHVSKGPSDGVSVVLDGRPVSRISAFVREGDFDDTPAVLHANKGIAFVGSFLLGMGFTFDDINAAKGKATSLSEMKRLIDMLTTSCPRRAASARLSGTANKVKPLLPCAVSTPLWSRPSTILNTVASTLFGRKVERDLPERLLCPSLR